MFLFYYNQQYYQYTDLKSRILIITVPHYQPATFMQTRFLIPFSLLQQALRPSDLQDIQI